MKQPWHITRIGALGLSILLAGYLLLWVDQGRHGEEERVKVRIFSATPGQEAYLRSLALRVIGRNGSYVDAVVTPSQFYQLAREGYEVTPLSDLNGSRGIDPRYPTLEAIEAFEDSLTARYSHIALRLVLGTSTQKNLPLYGIKISDNPRADEDEPAVLFTGVHHAREPLGEAICRYLMQYLCENYSRSERVRRWVNNIEIWFVPVVNPEGYKFMMDNHLQFPWWRKNLRDNDGNGLFDPSVDGVDLNRNYDYNWAQGGDGDPSSWFYRGPAPFSEKEIQALRDLTLRENFVFGIGYHSYGEAVLFPWGNFHRPPDMNLIIELASRIASQIRRQSGRGTYSVLPLNGQVGQSSVWMYGEAGVIDFIIETGAEYFPSAETIQSIAEENAQGAFVLLDRVFGAGLTGHVTDGVTRLPVRADVVVREHSAPYVKPRHSDEAYGRYFRILQPGIYTVEFSAPGYLTKIIREVEVRDRPTTVLDVELEPKAVSGPAGGNHDRE